MKPQRNSTNSKKSNLFSKWVGESNQKYSGKEMGHAFLACLSLVVLALVLTSGTRYYNYEHFINHEGGFLADGFGYQLSMFLVYGILSIGAVLWSAVASHKSGKKLMLGAAMAGMGVAAIGVLALLAGLDFASIFFYVHQAHLSLGVLGRMLNAYFVQYSILYVIPLSLAAISFGVQAYYKNRQDETSGDYGTAKLADRSYLKAMGAYDEKGMLFGKDDKGRFLRYPNCHRTIVSYSGGGKTSSVIMPTLLTTTACVLANDYKGELCAVSARYRVKVLGHDLAGFDPYGVLKKPGFISDEMADVFSKECRFNPFDMLPEDEGERDREIGRLVESMMKRGSSSKSDHFDEMAMSLLRGVIEWAYTTEGNPTLIQVHDMLSSGKNDTKAFLESMLSASSARVRGVAARVSSTAKEERGSIFSSAYRQVSWLGDPCLAKMVSETTVDLKKLLTGKMDVFVVLQDPESSEQSRAFRVILNCVRSLILKTPMSERSDEGVLFLLDELGQMGYCKDIESMIPIMRSYKVAFWSVFQTLSQIQEYPKADYFTGAKMLQFFGINDLKTIEWVEKLGGTFTSVKTSTSESKGNKNNRNESVSVSETGAKLFHTNEIREMPENEQIVFIQGKRPIKCERIPYFSEPFFEGRFDRNPVEDK